VARYGVTAEDVEGSPEEDAAMRVDRPSSFVVAALVCAATLGSAPAHSQGQPITTPGALASVPVPGGWQSRYIEQGDVVVMGIPQRSEVLVTVAPAAPPAVVLRSLLAELNSLEYASRIEPVEIGGLRGALMRADVNDVRHWFAAVARDQVVLLVRAISTASFAELEPIGHSLVRNTRIAPATYPPLVVGHYQIGSESSADSRGGLYARDFLTLHPDGAVETSGSISGSVGGVSALGQGRRAAGTWEVRGNRLLIWDGEEGFVNFRVQAFRNGLELHAPGRDRPILAVRQ
jgi:hypothetical protein